MFVIIPLIIQIQGNQVRVGVANPASFTNETHPSQSHHPRAAAGSGDGPTTHTLREKLMNPSVN